MPMRMRQLAPSSIRGVDTASGEKTVIHKYYDRITYVCYRCPLVAKSPIVGKLN